MNPDLIRAAVKEATHEAIQEELGQFYIDRETHYQDHQFVHGLREWMDDVRSTTIKTITRAIVGGTILLIVLGFVFWGKGYLK